MFKALKINFLILFTISIISCNEAKKTLSHSVAEIKHKNAREIEEMGNFYVNGKVNGKINLGFIKAFTFVDVNNDDEAIYIISNHKTLPSYYQETTIKLRIYQELSINNAEFLVYEEIRD